MANRVDELISKGTGAAKSIKARVDGLVGVFQALAEQHGEASALVKRLKSDPSRFEELWPKIRIELKSHEQSELRELYPVLRGYPETRALADQHDAEAAELSTLIDQIDTLGSGTSEWTELFDQLATKLDAHVAEEEKQIFPQAQRAMGSDRARELEKPVLEAKKQVVQAA